MPPKIILQRTTRITKARYIANRLYTTENLLQQLPRILWNGIGQPYDFSYIRQRDLYRIQSLLTRTKFFVIPYKTYNFTLFSSLTVFNVGHLADCAQGETKLLGRAHPHIGFPSN
jgi:hypothetical protein